jgi:hypothetical protein
MTPGIFSKAEPYVRARRLAVRALALACLLACAADARAQKLGIQGDRFTVDGTPKFLTFVTYFGGMGAPNVVADLHLMKTLGFDGFRIWPLLDTGPQILNGDGSLRPGEMAHFLSILDQAKQERLIVDVTFTHEHIAGLTPANTRVGLANVASAMRSYENVLIDIQNERNVQDRRFLSEPDVLSIYQAIKAVDPARIVGCSEARGDAPGPATGASFVARLGLDVTMFHETRSSDWYTFGVQQYVISALRTNGRPAYMQEPMTTRDSFFVYPSHDRAEYFLQAIANAKLAGAAGWTFHTEVGVDFRTGAPFFEDRLREYPEPEWAFVNSLKPRVVLRTNNGVNYLVAENGGGAGVRADRSAGGPGSWEIFDVSDLAGGPLISGDHVSLGTADGKHFLQAAGGGGGQLRASSESVGALETFTIEKPGGGVIRHGDAVALRAGDSSWYVSAQSGGGSLANVTGTARGAFETFTILFVTPHSTGSVSAGAVRDASGAKR